ncbi:hypothetical protein COU49_02060 [Candidatus Nomurabacteria bacterium CG10_big_fil_rev_8_21_14_0_10_35_16]|uniref:Thioredoxin domain-containing protein n=1 Tax=Candidatus Nomurabacteria bacterium CG10_big_fil_rev_8_21_14_0_10_35_16 TaxID=1974731 RepID=A0A2H0TB43_9BACT|nr:MAG: hypothetical protein COU49_02060 [Candidatus Nomurabacteria bacterium CG10_big_fil_rev_8_21_14_0_10_35_16]
MSNIKIFVSVIVILILGVVMTVLLRGTDTPADLGQYDEFAQCLADSGTLFYGAFWCSHCQTQKKMFGSSAKFLPYVECSPANGQGQFKVCQDANIEGYPTWEFPDGSRLSGELSFETLSEKTSCALPSTEATSSVEVN